MRIKFAQLNMSFRTRFQDVDEVLHSFWRVLFALVVTEWTSVCDSDFVGIMEISVKMRFCSGIPKIVSNFMCDAVTSKHCSCKIHDFGS